MCVSFPLVGQNNHFFFEAFSASFSALRCSFSRSFRSRSLCLLSLSAAERSSLSRCLSRARSTDCGTSNLMRTESIVRSSSPRTPLAAKCTTHVSNPAKHYRIKKISYYTAFGSAPKENAGTTVNKMISMSC